MYCVKLFVDSMFDMYMSVLMTDKMNLFRNIKLKTPLICKLVSWVFFAASFVACDPDIPELTLLPEVYLDGVCDVTRNAATLEVYIVPNGQANVFVEYACVNDSVWEKDSLPQSITGVEMLKIDFRLHNLHYGSKYLYRVSVRNKAGLKQTETWTFHTHGYNMAKIQAMAWETDLDAGVTTTIVIPSDDDTTLVSAEMRALPTEIWTIIRPEQTFFGRDSIKLSINLSNLSPDTEYQIAWKAKNRGGDRTVLVSMETYAVVDYDGNKYHSVTIGTQTWLRENFRGTHYTNGDPIPNVTSNEEWSQLSTGAYCWYNNDPKIGQDYGGLYNWWVAADERGLINGYKTPTSREFVTLGNYVANGVTCDAGPALTEKGNDHWNTSFGTNTSGFSARANGARASDGRFIDFRDYATYITNSTDDPPYTYSLREINPKGWFDTGLYSKKIGAGIRLLKK